MDKTEKLRKVFDFIAEYLSESQPEVTTTEPVVKADEMELTNKGDDSLKRAYTLMKKLDERDKQHATVVTEVKKATEPLKEELNRIKKEYEEQLNLDVLEEIKEAYNPDSLPNQIEVTSKSYKKKSTSKDAVTTVTSKPIKSILEK
jgi:hypothetical protein